MNVYFDPSNQYKNKSKSVSDFMNSRNFHSPSVTARASVWTQLTGPCCWYYVLRWSSLCHQITHSSRFCPTKMSCGCLTASCSTSLATSYWAKSIASTHDWASNSPTTICLSSTARSCLKTNRTETTTIWMPGAVTRTSRPCKSETTCCPISP